MSIGADRIRVTFNPSEASLVDVLKHQTAHLIDLCAESKEARPHDASTGEVNRLWALAMTAYEEAAMWAVKAATA